MTLSTTQLRLPSLRGASILSLSLSLLLLLLYPIAISVVAAFDPPSVFPVSTRQALLQKSKEINPAQQYTAAGWSNRAATVLTPQHLDPDVYTADRPFYWNGIDVGCRCTVVALPPSSGGGGGGTKKPDLWVHSPVGLDGPLLKAISELGNVKYVVSPNYEHVKFAPQW